MSKLLHVVRFSCLAFPLRPLLSLAGVMTTGLLGIWDHGTRPWVRPARPLGSTVTAPRAVTLSVGRRRWIRGAFEVKSVDDLKPAAM